MLFTYSYVRRVLRYLDQPTGGFVIFEYANGFQSTLRYRTLKTLALYDILHLKIVYCPG